MGAGAYANSLDYSNLRLDIKSALKDQDEVALAGSIDIAREMGREYPHQKELDHAEASLYEMMMCPDQSLATSNDW